MAYDIDGRLKRDRTTGINNLMGFGQPEKINEFCKPCYYSGLSRLIPHPKETGKLLCRNCGKSYDIEEIKKEKAKPTKSLTKPQHTPLIISQNGKDKKKPKFDTPNSELTDEDLADLRGYGYRL